MSNFNHLIAHTGPWMSEESRVKVELNSTAWVKGKSYRMLWEINKAATATRILRFTSTKNFIIKRIGITLDSGAARITSIIGGTFGGTFTPVPVRSRNLLNFAPVVPTGMTVGTALAPTGTVTGGVEADIKRMRCPPGTQSISASFSEDALFRGLPPGDYAIVIAPIDGVTTSDITLGVLDMFWDEIDLPYEAY